MQPFVRMSQYSGKSLQELSAIYSLVKQKQICCLIYS